MNEILARLLRLLLHAVALLMGLLFFASLLAAALLLALVWALRAAWARLTGQPVSPWTMRMDPRSGFDSAFRSAERWSARRSAQDAKRSDDAATPRRSGQLPGADEVTDVEPREPRKPR